MRALNVNGSEFAAKRIRQKGFLLMLCLVILGFAVALHAQYVLLFEPCPLCIFQRIALFFVGCFALLGSVGTSKVGFTKGCAYGVTLCSGIGAGIALWHVRLQWLPADEVPSCGPGLTFMLETLPLGRVLEKVFLGSGECATIDWSLFGLSMPMWSAFYFSVLIMVGIQLCRKRDACTFE